MSDQASRLVKATQMMLVHAGYLRAPVGGDDPIDGLLGTATLSALERYNFDQFLKGKQWTVEQMERAKLHGEFDPKLRDIDRQKERELNKKMSDVGSLIGEGAALKADGPKVTMGQERVPPVKLGAFDFHGLQHAVDARARHIDPEGVLSPLFFSTELAGEIGEACNVVKKIERERLGIAGSRDDAAHLAKELADSIITACNVARHYGIDLHRAIVDVFNLTSAERGLPVSLR